MPRKPRASVIGEPEHVIQRGNNRQVIFTSDEDMKACAAWLREYSVKFEVAVHAWILMTNHGHMICTLGSTSAISNMMQAHGRSYVRHFNRVYKYTGTLREVRFRSSLVQ